jgi:4-oxalocrotonate tautomerase
MPHIIVKLWPGETEAQKKKLTDAIVRGVRSAFGYGEESVSVGFEEVTSSEWDKKVFKPDILDKWDTL